MRANDLMCDSDAMKSGLAEFRRLVVNDPMEVILPLAIFLAITFLAGWLVRRLVLRALRSWNARTGSRAGEVIYQSTARAGADLGADPGRSRGLPVLRPAGALYRISAPMHPARVMDYLPDGTLHARDRRSGELLRGAGAGRHAGDHAHPEPGADRGGDPRPADPAQSLQCLDHADPHGLGRRRPGRSVGAAGHSLQSFRRDSMWRWRGRCGWATTSS